jgi:hypothetical protein
MLHEGVRELGVEKQVVVQDLAELLLQSVVIRDETGAADYISVGVDQEVKHV